MTDEEIIEQQNAYYMAGYPSRRSEKKMTKDEMKNRISMALKDPILQQGFECICKENAELKEKLKPENCLKLLAKGGYVKFTNDQLTKAKEIIDKLSKSLFLAKGIIRDLIDDTVDFKESKERAIYCYEQEHFDTYKEAVQFLKEVEK